MLDWIVALTLAVVLPPGVSPADLDLAGNIRVTAAPPSRGPASNPSTPCGGCSDPVRETFGVEVKDGDLWVLSFDGTMVHLSSCGVVETISIEGFRGFATGLAWDSRRGVFAVTDALFLKIDLVTTKGIVVGQLSAPDTGFVGIAYDPGRDLYWITNWHFDTIFSVDPNTGRFGPAFHVPEGSRIGGTGYDAARDALIYNGRNEKHTYIISASRGDLLTSFALPVEALDFNNGEDVGVAADGSAWIHLFEPQGTYCFRALSESTPVVGMTWGRLKTIYR